MQRAYNFLLGWLLSESLDLTEEENAALFEVARFATFVYPRIWFRAPFACDNAPLDMWLGRCAKSYERLLRY